MTTSVTYTFANSTTSDATQVNQNFTDVITGLNELEKLTARGDLLTRGASSHTRLALGTAGKVLRSDGTDVTWAFQPTVTAKSADYTVTDIDGVECIYVTTSSTTRTITLPTAADNTNRRLTITKVDSGTGFVTIDGEGAETIDGATTQTLSYQYQSITIHCNGTAWFTSNIYRPATSQIRCNDGAGHGAVNTKIRLFNNATTIGSAISTTQSANSGRSFTINEAGIYSIFYADAYDNGRASVGISLNSSQLTTAITAITTADRLSHGDSPASGLVGNSTAVVRLAAGDVIRPHTDGTPQATNDYQTVFTITQLSAY